MQFMGILWKLYVNILESMYMHQREANKSWILIHNLIVSTHNTVCTSQRPLLNNVHTVECLCTIAFAVLLKKKHLLSPAHP